MNKEEMCPQIVNGNIRLPLTAEEKVEMIEFYFDCYSNTDQDVEEFAPEFFCLTQSIISGQLPCRLRHLSEYKGLLVNQFPKYDEAITSALNETDSKWLEVRCTHYDDYEQKHFVDAWETINDNEEGKVIAKIDLQGNIEYFDDAAETDLYVQEIIARAINEITEKIATGNN